MLTTNHTSERSRFASGKPSSSACGRTEHPRSNKHGRKRPYTETYGDIRRKKRLDYLFA
jgi:hypothetical protein